MSNEENTEQPVESTTEQPVEQVSVEPTEKPEAIANTASSAADKAGNIITTVMQLKEKNPKVFFGAIGGVVLLLLIIMMTGGDSKPTISGPTIKTLVKGNKYVLKSANSYEPGSTIRLVSSPDNIAAYDDTEEADRNASCQHIPQGTPITVLELQDMYGTKNMYAKVQVDGGECKGKDGWALSIDVQ